MNQEHDYVLGLHPSSRGFGWVLFEGNNSPFDWGTADIRGGANLEALLRVGVILDKYQPRALALEEFEGKASRRAPRIRQLYRAIIARAKMRGIPVYRYSRQDIGDTFAAEGARTREGIAAAVAGRIAVLRRRLPKPRKIWEGEHPNIALFCAAACALTYYRLSGGFER